MTIACTGHRGFIGSHLWEKLKGGGHKLIGIDLKEGRDIRTLEPEDFRGVDVVFHLAAQPKVPLSIIEPEFTNDHNITGTLRVLQCAKEAGVKRVVYSASSSAYGEQATLPLNEDMLPNPMSPYAVQKLVGEYYCKVYYELHGLETVSLRYFNVYGEGMKADDAYSAAIAIFLDQKAKNKPLTVFGGKQTRDFTYVEDVVDANILAMHSTKVGHGEVINIGSGKNYSIMEIAQVISDNIKVTAQRTGEPMVTLADITRASRLLRYKPTMDLLKWLAIQLS